MDLRKLVLILHRWVGLVAALALLAIAVSAALLIFERPLDRALNTSLVKVVPTGPRLSLNEIARRLGQAYPQCRVAVWTLPQSSDEAVAVVLECNSGVPASASSAEAIEIALNPYSGEIMGDVEKANPLMARVHQFHTHFLAGKAGSAIVGWSAVCLLFLNLTGIILWWRRKIGRFRWSSSGTSFYFHVHQAVGIYAWAFLMLLSVTGIAIHWEREASRLADRLTGSPAPAKMLPSDPLPPGANPIDSDEIVSIAEKNAPGANVTRIQMSSGSGQPVRVIMKYPEDHTPAGRSQVYLDAYTGKVRLLTDARLAPLGFKLMRLWNRQYHTGDIFGWPTQTVALIFSLALVVMVITGPMIWYKRRRATHTATAAAGED